MVFEANGCGSLFKKLKFHVYVFDVCLHVSYRKIKQQFVAKFKKKTKSPRVSYFRTKHEKTNKQTKKYEDDITNIKTKKTKNG